MPADIACARQRTPPTRTLPNWGLGPTDRKASGGSGSRARLGLSLVGGTGIEPVTSSVSGTIWP